MKPTERRRQLYRRTRNLPPGLRWISRHPFATILATLFSLSFFYPIVTYYPHCERDYLPGIYPDTHLTIVQGDAYRATTIEILRREGLFFYRDTGREVRVSASLDLMSGFLRDEFSLHYLEDEVVEMMLMRASSVDVYGREPEGSMAWLTRHHQNTRPENRRKCWYLEPFVTGIPPSDE